MFSNFGVFHFLLFLIVGFLGGCKSAYIQTYEPFLDDPKTNSEDDAGTPELWDDLKGELLESQKPKALLLEHGEESLLLRINLIRSAQKDISIQTFSWEFDEVGKFILWELIEANQQRGVKVKLLIDHMFNEHRPDLIAYLSTLSPDFEIKYFNPSAPKVNPSFLEKISSLAIDFHDHNARLHNKLFVIDDYIAITGGRNVNNHYYDQVIGLNYKDRDVLVLLPDTSEVLDCLDIYWNSDQSVPTKQLIDVSKRIKSKNFPSNLGKADFFDYAIFEEFSNRANNADLIRDLFLKDLMNVEKIEWVYDLPDKVEEAPVRISTVSEKLLELIRQGQDSIFIQSPYVVLSKNVQDAFLELKKNKNDLRVVISTNSLAATDNWITYAANYKEKRIYLEELGLEMWEFKPIPKDISKMMNYTTVMTRLPFKNELKLYQTSYFKDDGSSIFRFFGKANKAERQNQILKTTPFLSLHAKSLVVDKRISFVGSYNLDPRSDIYNTELGIVLYDANFSEKLMKSINRDIDPDNSYLIANKKDRPMLSSINRLLYRVSEAIPFLDPWPIRRHSAFELKDGRESVGPGHHQFFSNWKNVGNFPQLSLLDQKQLSARIFKAMGMIFKPLI